LEERCTVIENEELMQRLMYYGRWIPRDFVTRSSSIDDVICYLRVEREFEILRLTSFVTTNLINFERIKDSQFKPLPSPQKDSGGDTLHVKKVE
jgi:hypothetical protein